MAIAARMAMMITTIISSISVKPCCLRAIGALLFSVVGESKEMPSGRKAHSDTGRGWGDGRHPRADGLPVGRGGAGRWLRGCRSRYNCRSCCGWLLGWGHCKQEDSKRAGIAQLVEQRIRNAKVVGS